MEDLTLIKELARPVESIKVRLMATEYLMRNRDRLPTGIKASITRAKKEIMESRIKLHKCAINASKSLRKK